MHGLTGITDENGARFATWTYDGSGRATSSQHAGGVDAVTLYYGSFSASANDGRTIVVDSFGATRTYYYRVVGGMARLRYATDGSSGVTSTFDVNGNLATYRDANGTQTNYTYDLQRNLEISRTEAYGTPVARTITTQWHPVHRLPARITAPSGVAGVARDDGLRLRRAGQSSPEDDHRGHRRRANGRMTLQRVRPAADGRRSAHGHRRRHDVHVLRPSPIRASGAAAMSGPPPMRRDM